MHQYSIFFKLFLLSCLTFLITLFSVQYIGEESVYTLQSSEMLHTGNYLIATEYGDYYRRPPLFNWLIIFFTQIIGEQNLLQSARIVSALSTIASGLLIRKFVRDTWGTATMGDTAALIFITSWQPLLYYGWLGYSDALFSALSVTAIFATWLWLDSKKKIWLLLASIALLSGVMTKAITIYAFYGSFVLSYLIIQRRLRPFLNFSFILSHLCIFALMATWSHFLYNQGLLSILNFLGDPTGKFTPYTLTSYLTTLIEYLFQGLVVYFLPWSFVIAYLTLKKKINYLHISNDKKLNVLLLTTALSIFPYLLAPHGSHRYILPLYALLACVLAVIFYSKKTPPKLIYSVAIWAISFKVIAASVLYPMYISYKRPNIEDISNKILLIADGKPIYSKHFGWEGFAISTEINKKRKNNLVQKYTHDLEEGYVFSQGKLEGENNSLDLSFNIYLTNLNHN